MGVFDFLKRKDKAPPPTSLPDEKERLMTLTEVAPGISLPKALAFHWAEI